jgi:formylglycine-generating enzyme required for sulfatase activity
VILNSFLIEEYEVSVTQYVAFLNTLGPGGHLNGCQGEPCAAVNGSNTAAGEDPFSPVRYNDETERYEVTNTIFANRPMTYVTWFGAEAYCEALNRRLPTEAEWEFAARGAEGRLYPWGNFWDATYTRTSRPTNAGGPDDINAFPNDTTPEDVFNLGGNVSEWIFDWYDDQAYKSAQSGVTDPRGPVSSPVNQRVVRGGDWDALPLFARSVHRRSYDPARVYPFVGFRCASEDTAGAQSGANNSGLSSGAGN